MLKILLASHGKLSQGMKNSLEILVGNKDNIEIMCAYLNEDFNLNFEVSNYLRSIENEDELIIVTDIFGGSINNEFMNQLNKYKFYLISGMNLGLIIELAMIEDTTNIEEQIKLAIKNSTESLKFCNDLVSDCIEDDIF